MNSLDLIVQPALVAATAWVTWRAGRHYRCPRAFLPHRRTCVSTVPDCELIWALRTAAADAEQRARLHAGIAGRLLADRTSNEEGQP